MDACHIQTQSEIDQGLTPLDPDAACSGLPLRLRRPCRDAARPRNTANDGKD